MSTVEENAKLRFTDAMLTRPPLSRSDARATLAHFAIISYAVDPDRVRPHLHPRFEIDCFVDSPAGRRTLVSMVPFEDQDFHFVGTPWLKRRFGQTNYRSYVIDRETGERAVWFFGTSLDSSSVAVPRHVWKLPWHRGRVRFDCQFDAAAGRYIRYQLRTQSDWAPVELELEDTGEPCSELCGINDFEAGWVTLTHPQLGVCYRRDSKLTGYRVYHDRLCCNVGHVMRARIGLFDRLGLVPYDRQLETHSVLIQHCTEFAIYLPPRVYQSRTAGRSVTPA